MKKFPNFFILFLWVIFALLYPDPESGSTDLIESGSETLVSVMQDEPKKRLPNSAVLIISKLKFLCFVI
jgi:hypothetical protein